MLKENKNKLEKIIEAGNLKRKGKILYFPSRKQALLDAIPYELFDLNETYDFDITQEIFSLSDVSFITNEQSEFMVYRGFNFSTTFKFNKSKGAFLEKEYDNDYYARRLISQDIKRVNNKRIDFDFKDVIRILFGIGSFIIITLFFCIGLLMFPT